MWFIIELGLRYFSNWFGIRKVSKSFKTLKEHALKLDNITNGPLRDEEKNIKALL